jgi:DNA-binding transcriptional LysR family regulator
LSRQIKALEAEIGHSLFERQAHSIRLTPVGEALLRETRELLQHADQALERVRAAAHSVCLRVGYAPSLAEGILPLAVKTFTQAHSDSQVELYDLSSAELLTGLNNESIDLALMVGEQRATSGLTWTQVVRIPWQLAIPSSHPLVRQPRVSLIAALGEPLLIFCKRDYPEYWALISNWVPQPSRPPRIAGEYDGIHSLMSAVASGLGVAFVAVRPGRLVPKQVRLKTLAPTPEPLCISAGYRTDRSQDKPLAVFVAELRRAAGWPTSA